MTAYEGKVDEEIDRWVAAQLEQAPELWDEAVDGIWRLLRGSTSTE